MKKIFVIACVACIAVSAWAAELPKQGFGIQIGWTQPILRLNDPSNPSTAKDSLTNITKLKGFKVGIVYDGSIAKGFGCSMGLNYTFAGNTSAWDKVNTSYSSRTRTLYQEAEVFVDWQYKFEVAKETYLMLYSGPTIQFGIGMKNTTYQRNEMTDAITTTQVERYKTDDADEVLKRLNVTWGVGAGFQYQRYFLRGGYDFGLIVPYKNGDFSNGNHARGRLDQWNIKIGMYLWYK